MSWKIFELYPRNCKLKKFILRKNGALNLYNLRKGSAVNLDTFRRHISKFANNKKKKKNRANLPTDFSAKNVSPIQLEFFYGNMNKGGGIIEGSTWNELRLIGLRPLSIFTSEVHFFSSRVTHEKTKLFVISYSRLYQTDKSSDSNSKTN